MPAGLINIISVGANDLYLTGAPQITFFKVIYRRYTNFSKESVILPINNLQFNEAIDIDIPKNADLLGELYLQITLPSIYFTREQLEITNIQPITYPNALSDYANIVEFMKYNTGAYRIALDDVNAIGISPAVMITDVINSFGTYNTETYSSTLLTYYKTYINNKNYSYPWLDPTLSNISTIGNNILSDISININNWTNQSILAIISNAIYYSTLIQNYFFNNTLLYNKEIAENNSLNAKFAWVDRIGHSIIDYIDIYIGGEKIERHTGDWLNIWYELTGNKEQEEMYDKMIGNVRILKTFDRNTKPSYILNIPLSFWFCKNVGLSLPLIALQYNDVKLTLKLKELQDCAYVENSGNNTDINLQDLWDDNGFILNANLLADYVYLDNIERKRFAVSAHECLIERVQMMSFDNISNANLSVQLDFRSPCKEIIWITQKDSYINNTTNYYKSMWNNYSLEADNKGNPIASATLSFNGYQRFSMVGSAIEGSYFNYVQPYACHTNTPSDGINNYNFCLYPEEYQPSGSCNFSIISLVSLNLTFNQNAFYYNEEDIDSSVSNSNSNSNILVSPYPAVWKYNNVNYNSKTKTTLKLSIFARSYNILRIVGGMGALAYY